eukprot:g65027.t1
MSNKSDVLSKVLGYRRTGGDGFLWWAETENGDKVWLSDSDAKRSVNILAASWLSSQTARRRTKNEEDEEDEEGEEEETSDNDEVPESHKPDTSHETPKPEETKNTKSKSGKGKAGSKQKNAGKHEDCICGWCLRATPAEERKVIVEAWEARQRQKRQERDSLKN